MSSMSPLRNHSNIQQQGAVRRVMEKFRVPNSLDFDFRSLLADAHRTGDLTLTFAPLERDSYASSNPDDVPASSQRRVASDSVPVVRCHSYVLAARSPFFRSVIERRLRKKGSEFGEDAPRSAGYREDAPRSAGYREDALGDGLQTEYTERSPMVARGDNSGEVVDLKEISPDSCFSPRKSAECPDSPLGNIPFTSQSPEYVNSNAAPALEIVMDEAIISRR